MNFLFLAESADAAAPVGGGATQWITLIISFALIAVVFYFFMYRPQKKQEKKNAEMKNSLAVGDEVTTIGGIVGRVINLNEETFVLETTRNCTKIRFLRSALRSIDVKVDGEKVDSKDSIDTNAIPQVELKDEK